MKNSTNFKKPIKNIHEVLLGVQDREKREAVRKADKKRPARIKQLQYSNKT